MESILGKRAERESEDNSENENQPENEIHLCRYSPDPNDPAQVSESVAPLGLQINHKRPRVPLLEGCRSVECYEHLNKIDEGAYGVVYRARDKQTDEIVAIKKLKLDREKEGFPITALRELSTLISLKHHNIVNVKEVVYGSSLDKIYVVMEYMDHELKSILEDRRLNFSHA